MSGHCRYDAHSGGEREIQRTMLELLNQLDGFDSRGDVKVLQPTELKALIQPCFGLVVLMGRLNSRCQTLNIVFFRFVMFHEQI